METSICQRFNNILNGDISERRFTHRISGDGMFKCGGYDFCPYIERLTLCLYTGRFSKCKGHVDCDTEGAVYMLTRASGAFHVGKTIIPSRRHLYDHTYGITTLMGLPNLISDLLQVKIILGTQQGYQYIEMMGALLVALED